MNFTIAPLQLDEVDAYNSIQFAAFDPIEADMIMPMIFPNGLTPELQLRLRNRVLSSTNNDPGSVCICARDTDTGEIAGVARWEANLEPPQTRAEIDAKFAKANQSRETLPLVEGENVELYKAFFQKSFCTMHELAGGKPHMELAILATHPKYHRKGVGSLLLQYGLKKADEMKLPAYLVSSKSGKPLYERFGFECVGDFQFDARKYGGRSEGRHWCMARPAKA